MKTDFNWKKFFKVVFRILLIIVIILSITVVTLAGTFFFVRWQRNVQERASGDKNMLEQLLVPKKELEPAVTCLFLGVNSGLTDFIMLGQYDPNTREIDLVSIPRDSDVGNSSIDGKINSIYSSNKKNVEKVKEKVTEITGVEIDYYVLFETKILRKLVDEMGGITVDVPINMNYDDPYQNLHIHLKKGVQKLNGSQAEQFCRFRKNNNGTGYPGGDVDRTKAQQQFVKAFIKELLKAENIAKMNSLINIVLEGTKTDLTLNDAKNYIDDAIALRTDRITTDTLPGTPKTYKSRLGYDASFYVLDKSGIKKMIDRMFYNKGEDTDDLTTDAMSNSVISQRDEIRIELLNAGTTASVINDLVDKLKSENFYVVKIGNYESSKNEVSRIIDYGTGSDSLLDSIKTISKVTKVEEVQGQSSVDYTIILGPSYK